MGGDQTLFIAVIVALGLVMVGTFVLRPDPSALSARDGRMFIYVIRLAILVFGLTYSSRHAPHRHAASSDGDAYSADPTPDSPSSPPKTMEFHWSAATTTQRSP
jgi:hypothetical protein